MILIFALAGITAISTVFAWLTGRPGWHKITAACLCIWILIAALYMTNPRS